MKYSTVSLTCVSKSVAPVAYEKKNQCSNSIVKNVAKTAEQIQVKPTELAYLVLQQAFCMQQFTDFSMIAKQVKDDIKISFCNFLRKKTLSGDKPIARLVSLIT